jgi:DNA-binding Lrp family transcriptional regulator
MSKKFKLDSVDKQILHDLQENGRMTNVELPISLKAIMPISTLKRWAILSPFLPLLA